MTTGTTGARRYEVAVVGGGQAGLAIGHLLAKRGLRFVILEAGPAVGSAWHGRWDSLTLFTSRRYDSLPGLVFPGEAEGYPSRDEVIGYLEQYATRFELPVRLNSRVDALAHANGTYVLHLGGETIEADQVVVATGPFQTPFVPAVAQSLSADVVQMHSTSYRMPSDLPVGTVLVVGGGNTGFQIAAELAATHDVRLSIGSPQKPLPQRMLGRDLFWWLGKTGVLNKTVDSRLGRKLRDRDVLIGSSPRAVRRLGVKLSPRVTDASGRTITFADGTTLEPRAVLWATGYKPDYAWIQLPVVDAAGTLQHRRGVTGHRGLYFLGQQWQHTRGSALLGFVQHDAEYLAERIAGEAATPTLEESAAAAA